jgi:hypothetical protein
MKIFFLRWLPGSVWGGVPFSSLNDDVFFREQVKSSENLLPAKIRLKY